MATYTGLGGLTGPATTSTDGGDTYTFGVEFYVMSAASLTALQLWRPTTGMTGTITGRCYQVVTATTGTVVPGTDVTFTLSGTGWQTAALTAPVALTPFQRYRAAVNILHTYATTAAFYTTGAGINDTMNGPLVLPNSSNSTGGQNRYNLVVSTTVQTMTYPDSGGGDSYWIDVTVSTAPLPAPIQLNQAVTRAANY